LHTKGELQMHEGAHSLPYFFRLMSKQICMSVDTACVEQH